MSPLVPVPLEEALNDLTGFEVIGIQNHYGTELEKLGGARTLLGAVWAYRNRTETTSWHQVESMTMRDLDATFAKRDPDPDSEQGNLSNSGGPTPAG